MTKLAAIYFYKELELADLWGKAWIVNLVHDELNVECEEAYAEIVAKIVTKSMLDAGNIFCKTIPMIADANIVDSWSK